MMMRTHPNEEALQRLRHAELSSRSAADLDKHLQECAECRVSAGALAEDEREVLGLLELLDVELAAPKVAVVIARAQRESRFARYRRAAGIALVAATAGVAYAMPGSPLKGWIRSARSLLADAPIAERQAERTRSTSGIAVVPGEHFVIQVAAAQSAGEALVSLTDDSAIVVRSALGSATFTSEADRLVIEPHAPGMSVEIAIPRSAPRVEIHVQGERVFLKNGQQVITREHPDARARYRIALRQSAPQ